MTIEKIVNYVLHTPHNTNKAILIAMLESLVKSSGGDCEGCDHPDCPNRPEIPKELLLDGGDAPYSGGDLNKDGVIDLIYDGGIET